MRKSLGWVWLACAGIGAATPLSAGWVSNEAADVILGDARLPDPWTLRNPSDVDVEGISGKVFVVDVGRLRFSTQGAGTFNVQSSTDLKVWTDEAAYKLGAGVSQWHQRPADGVSRFFRIYEP